MSKEIEKFAEVSGKYPKLSEDGWNEGRFTLEANRPMHPSGNGWRPPIRWEGYVDGVKVEFIQIRHSAISENDFDFTGFPDSLQRVIPCIIEAIDMAMEVMD